MKLTKAEINKSAEDLNYILSFKDAEKRKAGLTVILARHKWELLSEDSERLVFKHSTNGVNAVVSVGYWTEQFIDWIKTILLGIREEGEE